MPFTRRHVHVTSKKALATTDKPVVGSESPIRVTKTKFWVQNLLFVT